MILKPTPEKTEQAQRPGNGSSILNNRLSCSPNSEAITAPNRNIKFKIGNNTLEFLEFLLF